MTGHLSNEEPNLRHTKEIFRDERYQSLTLWIKPQVQMRCLNGGIANKVLSGQFFEHYFGDPFIQRWTIIDLGR